ncbi:MAG: hypothetical protein ACREUG_05575, partial [Steroidobacteraceae bacterium]
MANAGPYPIGSGESHRLLSIVDSIRGRGCGGREGVGPPLLERSPLDGAARRLAGGAGLRHATDSVGYRAMSSVSLHVSGDLGDEAVG